MSTGGGGKPGQGQKPSQGQKPGRGQKPSQAKRRKPTKRRRDQDDARGDACPNCGSMAGDPLMLGRRRVCSDCLETALHPIERVDIAFQPMLGATLQVLRLMGWRAIALAWFMNAPIGMLLLSMRQPDVALGLYALAAAPLYWGALLELGLAPIDGSSPSIVAALKTGARRYLAMFLATLLKQLIVGVLMLLVPLGFHRLIAYTLVEPMVVAGEAKGADGLHLSMRRMKGHLWVGFWVFMVLGFVPGAIGLLDGIGVLRALAADAGALEAHALFAWLGLPLLGLPGAAMSVAFFVRLRRARRAEGSLAA